MKLPASITLNRRAALLATGGLIGAAAIGGGALLRHVMQTGASVRSYTPRGYGTDPDLIAPDIPWQLILSDPQLHVIAVLADIILPPGPNSPAPSTIGIPEFVNEWVSAPYPGQVKDREHVLEGLAWVETEVRQRGWPIRSRLILEGLDQEKQVELLQALTDPVSGAPRAFFPTLRRLVIGGYYTTAEGFAAIGYIGNVPLQAFPPPSDEALSRIEEELNRLGL